MTFDGSKSLSSPGSNPTYTWDFTDGTLQTLNGINPTYTFKNVGIFPVTLTVSDLYGVGTSTVTITVQSTTPPVAKITVTGAGSGQTVQSGQQLTFDGTGSYETGGNVTRYMWDFGDETTGTNVTVAHTYTPMFTGSFTTSYVYNVTLTVYDATGLSGNATTQITVTPSTSTQTAAPTSTTTTSPTPTASSTTHSTTTTAPTAVTYSTGASLPPAVEAILIVVTIVVFSGSAFWLRKRT